MGSLWTLGKSHAPVISLLHYPEQKPDSLPGEMADSFISVCAAAVPFLCSLLQSAGTSKSPFQTPCRA